VEFDVAGIDELLMTTKAVRHRLDLRRPVERELVVECIRLANYAPNASNRQEWMWVVVDDPELRRRIGEEYRRITVPAVVPMRDAKLAAGDHAGVRISESILYLADHMGEVPVLVIPCFDFRVGPSTPLAWTSRMFGSIYPAVWSFQLALRSRGLGSVFTNAHLLDDTRIGQLLHVPDNFTQTCLIPVAHTIGTDFRPSRRRPVEETILWNGWPP
jgi:nitroreductase